ncbi:pyridoxamine 5'-phosphate oxidase family protein [Microbacterium deminutum]|uniref:Pyridoxamine 5'-phosphate oxidase N-terminal domain-containing protein n=1 Tax=Microbacterium deminutum TaxID=344164 RepID=A0ABP5BE16_9MICO
MTSPLGALDPAQLQSLREILSANRLLSMATVSEDGRAHINTAFFAFAEDGTLFVLTPPHTEHARHLRTNPSAAVAVYDSHQTRLLRRGVQLFGEMAEVDAANAHAAFACVRARFADIGSDGEDYEEFIRGHDVRLVAFHPTRVKLFDEALLQQGEYAEVLLPRPR